jgi:hypothetical protein
MSSTPPSGPPGSTPAGWYPDTNEPGVLRYWDGHAWTEHTHRPDEPRSAGGPPSPGGSGYQTYSPGMGSPPNSQMVPAILTTLFCCLPLGIVSIVKAAQVNNLWSSGQHDAARKAAADARKWWLISLVVGLVVGVLYAGAILVGGTAEV